MTKNLISQITPMLYVTSQHLGLFKHSAKCRSWPEIIFPYGTKCASGGELTKHLRKDSKGDPGKVLTSLGDRDFMEVCAEVLQIPVILYQHGSLEGLSPGLLDKEHFAVCSWAKLVRLRLVLPMFYNCPDVCRQRLLINAAVILSVTFPSNSFNPQWVIIDFRADFKLSRGLCLPDPINGRFIALRWYFPALVQNRSRLRQGRGRVFRGSQSQYLFEVWGTCLKVLHAPTMR